MREENRQARSVAKAKATTATIIFVVKFQGGELCDSCTDMKVSNNGLKYHILGKVSRRFFRLPNLEKD
jgi:hypothetical protein